VRHPENDLVVAVTASDVPSSQWKAGAQGETGRLMACCNSGAIAGCRRRSFTGAGAGASGSEGVQRRVDRHCRREGAAPFFRIGGTWISVCLGAGQSISL
jgi:hypothetical protein